MPKHYDYKALRTMLEEMSLVEITVADQTWQTSPLDWNLAFFERALRYGAQQHFNDKHGAAPKGTPNEEKHAGVSLELGTIHDGTWIAGRARRTGAKFDSLEEEAAYLTIMSGLDKEQREAVDGLTKEERQMTMAQAWAEHGEKPEVKAVYEEKLRRLQAPKAPKLKLAFKL